MLFLLGCFLFWSVLWVAGWCPTQQVLPAVTLGRSTKPYLRLPVSLNSALWSWSLHKRPLIKPSQPLWSPRRAGQGRELLRALPCWTKCLGKAKKMLWGTKTSLFQQLCSSTAAQSSPGACCVPRDLNNLQTAPSCSPSDSNEVHACCSAEVLLSPVPARQNVCSACHWCNLKWFCGMWSKS